jgi:hypothetical protein
MRSAARLPHPTVAAKTKCLAQSNKSRTGAKPTNKRLPRVASTLLPQEVFRDDIEICNCVLVGRLFDDRIALGDRGYPDGIDRPTFQIAKSLQPQDANDPWWCTHGRRVADIHDCAFISAADVDTYENLRKE